MQSYTLSVHAKYCQTQNKQSLFIHTRQRHSFLHHPVDISIMSIPQMPDAFTMQLTRV